MHFDIVTIFPDFFGSSEPAAGIFGHGILRRALLAGLVRAETHNLRDYAHDRHHTVDDRPFGGGEGMVLKPEPLAEAVDALGVAPREARAARRESVVLLSAGGVRLDQGVAQELARLERVVLLCGRYEGVDERVVTLVADRELSVGDYVLSGGELAAAIVVDAVARLVPGVLGNAASSRFESFGAEDALLGGAAGGPPRATHGAGGLLDYPHYTRPAEFRGLAVPQVLTNGNHEEVRRWRREEALKRTARNRPDLLAAAEQAGALGSADREFLARLGREES
ncbi:MAG TPA: tRNA (guanosine(37)-N1)-methyltransferase TrmD [Acidobacteriaceae bacterium]